MIAAEIIGQVLDAGGHPPTCWVPRGLGGYGTPPGVPPLGDCVLARQIRSMPEDDHVPGVAEDLDESAAAADGALWWRVCTREPGCRTVEVDTPSGWTLGEWAAYAAHYHGPGCTREADRRASQAKKHRSTSMRSWRPPARAWRASLRRSSGPR